MVDANRRNDHQSPSDLVEFLPSEDIGQPLLGVFSMLASVVLNDQLKMFVRQVVPPVPAAIPPTNNQIDTWLRKSSQHEKQAKPGLLWRVHTFARQ